MSKSQLKSSSIVSMIDWGKKHPSIPISLNNIPTKKNCLSRILKSIKLSKLKGADMLITYLVLNGY